MADGIAAKRVEPRGWQFWLGWAIAVLFWGPIAFAVVAVVVSLLYAASAVLFGEPQSLLVVAISVLLAWGIARPAVRKGWRRVGLTVLLTTFLSVASLVAWLMYAIGNLS